MRSTEQLFYLPNNRTICVVFTKIECSVLMALVFYFKDLLEKVTMQRTQQFQLLFVTERTQLNATAAQLLGKLRLIALAET